MERGRAGRERAGQIPLWLAVCLAGMQSVEERLKRTWRGKEGPDREV